MAVSYVNYIFLIVGLSLMLGIAGVATGGGRILGTFFDFENTADGNMNISTINSNLTLTETGGSSDESSWFAWLWLILGASLAIGVGTGIVSRDIGQGLKAGIASTFQFWLFTDMLAILNYATNLSALGGLVGIVSAIIYIPIFITSMIAMASWIGGAS